MKMIKSVVVLLLFFCLSLHQVSAQSFRLMRYDENYSYLSRDTARSLYQKIKFIGLSPSHKYYLSIGGEVREEYAAFNNEDWGRVNTGKNDFLLQRYDLHADLHLNDNLRFFVQIRSALENGRSNGPRPIDEDQLNIQNLFADVKLWKSKNDSLIIRAGRQELNYGAGRLISVREGPNVRLYFTGAKAIYAYKKLSLDVFAMEADNVQPGVFDNHFSKQLNLWGAYSTLSIGSNNFLDMYYLGNHKNNVTYDEGTANEVRHTVGARLWKNNDGFVYDIESAYQFGTFGNGNISAWTASFDLGYIFGELKAKPAFGIRNDYISGDKKAGDGNLGTFNPIYPKGGYFGFDPQVGPVNLIDIHPYGSVKIVSKLTFLWDVIFNWRYSINDGVYRPSGSFNFTGTQSNKRFIGTGYLGKLSYIVNPFMSVDFGIQYFKTGPFIASEIPNHQNAILTNSRISFKF